MMVLCPGDKCKLILIFKEARVALAVGALKVQAQLSRPNWPGHQHHSSHLAFPFLSYQFFGFFCGFPPFNVPMPWCRLLHFGAKWLLKAKKNSLVYTK
jgi:hypothetical protein